MPSQERLAAELAGLLGALRHVGGSSRYACLVDRAQGVIAEDPPSADEPPLAALRGFLERGRQALFTIAADLAGSGPSEDAFEGWDDDDFFVCVVNGRVAAVVACADPEGLRDGAMDVLRALVDTLLRYDPAYRLDPQGRGLFLGRPRLDMIVAHREVQ